MMDERTIKKCERLARAISSDSVAYLKDAIIKSLEEDNFFEAETIKENPVVVAAPAGLLALGASAGFIFYRRRKDDTDTDER